MNGRKPFLLRLPPDLHAALAKWAADDLRSLNAQMEYLLRSAVSGAGRLTQGEKRERKRGGG
ncbi:MAG: toxin-antitoxin system HicB family antitoxin [Gemmatimonadales bacterium]